ncbi:MAG: ATP-binding protein, partial [Nitrososphaerales archaeon]
MTPNQIVERHINILPGVGVLGVLRHLNYQPWYALAEFVDNSVQSAEAHRRDLRKANGSRYRLEVRVDYEGAGDGRLTVG